jgi:hypothetical protein
MAMIFPPKGLACETRGQIKKAGGFTPRPLGVIAGCSSDQKSTIPAAVQSTQVHRSSSDKGKNDCIFKTPKKNEVEE